MGDGRLKERVMGCLKDGVKGIWGQEAVFIVELGAGVGFVVRTMISVMLPIL